MIVGDFLAKMGAQRSIEEHLVTSGSMIWSGTSKQKTVRVHHVDDDHSWKLAVPEQSHPAMDLEVSRWSIPEIDHPSSTADLA